MFQFVFFPLFTRVLLTNIHPHHTHLFSSIYIKILNIHKDFHFLHHNCKKGKGEERFCFQIMFVTQQWKFPLKKIFLYEHHLSVVKSNLFSEIAVIFPLMVMHNCNITFLMILQGYQNLGI